MNPNHSLVGFSPDEIDTAAPTRAARLKWVVVVSDALAPGHAANAAICVAAATARRVDGLLGADGVDAAGGIHPGLPWAGCTVLVADPATLAVIRSKAAGHEAMFVADMPADAQRTRVYDEYLAAIASSDEIEYYAVSVVGPRNQVDRLIGRLPLLA